MSFLARIFGSKPKQSPDEQFWQWLSDNRERLAKNIRDEASRDRTVSEISARLGQVEEGLAFELGNDGVLNDFVLSADGKRELFPTVLRLYQCAPKMEGWKVTAFKQPISGTDFRLHFQGLDVGPEDVWFEARHAGGEEPILVMFYLQGVESSESPGAGAAILLMDQMLGEFDAVMRVQPVDVKPLPDQPEAHGLMPLTELPKVVEQVFPRGRPN